MSINQETLFNAGIVIIFLYCFVDLLFKRQKLKKLRNNVENHSTSVREENADVSVYGIERKISIKENTSFYKINKNLSEYNELSAKINSSIQLISLFPMFGLFGTVWGLRNAMLGSVNNLDMSQIGLALSTTISGLLCAMLLKFYAAKVVIKEMEIVGYKISENDRFYNQWINIGKITNESSFNPEE